METVNFLMNHPFEFRVLLAVAAIGGGFALIKLFTTLSAAADAVLEKYRDVASANTGNSAEHITLNRRHALGMR